jgi:hypothetical protein
LPFRHLAVFVTAFLPSLLLLSMWSFNEGGFWGAF